MRKAWKSQSDLTLFSVLHSTSRTREKLHKIHRSIWWKSRLILGWCLKLAKFCSIWARIIWHLCQSQTYSVLKPTTLASATRGELFHPLMMTGERDWAAVLNSGIERRYWTAGELLKQYWSQRIERHTLRVKHIQAYRLVNFRLANFSWLVSSVGDFWWVQLVSSVKNEKDQTILRPKKEFSYSVHQALSRNGTGRHTVRWWILIILITILILCDFEKHSSFRNRTRLSLLEAKWRRWSVEDFFFDELNLDERIWKKLIPMSDRLKERWDRIRWNSKTDCETGTS